jgi:hypothetical protein
MRSHATRGSVRRAAITCSVIGSCLLLALPAHGSGRHPDGPDGAKSPGRAAAIGEGTGTLVALPPLVQPGRSPAAPPGTDQLVATFEPARPGRTVLLQRDTRRGWRTVDSAPQDRSG